VNSRPSAHGDGFFASLPFEIKYGGNSQAIDAAVAKEPNSAAVSVKDWNLDVVSASLESHEVEVLPESSSSRFDSIEFWPAKTGEFMN